MTVPSLNGCNLFGSVFGTAREQAGKSIKELEDCTANFTRNTEVPYGYSYDIGAYNRLAAIADFLGCSVDYLLCRTDVKEMATEAVSESGPEKAEPDFISGAWYPATVEPPVGVELILIDSGGYADTGKYKGCGEYTMDFGDPVTLWTLMPQEKDVSQTAPVAAGWRTGNPEAYGTYVAYVRLKGADKDMLRELLWDGEDWSLFGSKIAEDVTVKCWAEQPDF